MFAGVLKRTRDTPSILGFARTFAKGEKFRPTSTQGTRRFTCFEMSGDLYRAYLKAANPDEQRPFVRRRVERDYRYGQILEVGYASVSGRRHTVARVHMFPRPEPGSQQLTPDKRFVHAFIWNFCV
jgi:hypothetical protein